MSTSEVPSGLTTPSVAARALASSEQPVATGGWFSGAEQLTSDTRIMLLLLRDARNRACARLFGVSEQDAGLVTIIALALLAQAANRKAHKVLKPIRAIRRSDAWLGEGMLNEGLYRIAGESAREAPFIGSLILASVLLHRLRPVLRVSFHDLRVAAHRLRLDFDHHYGHLIRPNRPPRQPTGP
jgi:hypothetical protein